MWTLVVSSVARSGDPRGCFHRGPGRGRFALEASCGSFGRPLRHCTPGRRTGVHRLGCCQARTAAPTPPQWSRLIGVGKGTRTATLKDRSLRLSLCHCEQSNGRHWLPGP
jgi:hypothetical protein